ncbi:MAG: hypothetical protein Q8R28_01680 [Dehalococcoidia bacterium]|nr:hypothetical protein [Dehalococcoidia bacterium]
MALNIADLVLSNKAFAGGGGELSLLRFLKDNPASFGAMKGLMPALVGALLVVRKQKRILAVLTVAMAGVVAYNAYWVIRFYLL